MWGEIKMTWHSWLGTCCWIVAWLGKRLRCRDTWSSINVLKRWWVFSGGRRSKLERKGMGTAAERQQSHYTLIYLCCPMMVVGGLVSSGDCAAWWAGAAALPVTLVARPSLPLVYLTRLVVIEAINLFGDGCVLTHKHPSAETVRRAS